MWKLFTLIDQYILILQAESKQTIQKKSKKKSKNECTEVYSGVNTGDSSCDIANVNKPTKAFLNSNVLDTT